MITPPGISGVAFTEATDGDLRHDLPSREVVSAVLGIPAQWATLRQVHGDGVVEAPGPGELGEADAAWSSVPGLPLAVFTADCLGVVLHAPGGVGVAHVGWRGSAAGVVGSLAEVMTAAGFAPERAVIGPGIGECCFEVGEEVAERFPLNRGLTTWGTLSVDLVGSVRHQLAGLEPTVVEGCTRHMGGRFFSHRRDGTRRRQAAIGWIP